METTDLVKRDTTQHLAPHEQDINALIARFDESRFNLLVPKMMMSGIPDGMRLVATTIQVSPDPKDGDVYPTQNGKLGIGKAKLNQIAAALGADWQVSRRVGDKTHPHYVEWEVVGRFILPDGTVTTERANKTIDMRSDIGDGTPGADLEDISKTAGGKKRTPDAEIRRVRRDIQSLAETKAKNRAIRAAAGLQTSYTAAQLKKPFVAVRLAVDPHSEIGARAVLGAVTGSSRLLFGPQNGHIVDASFEEPEERTEEPAEAPPAQPDTEEPQQAAAETYQNVGPPPLDEVKRAYGIVRKAWGVGKQHGMEGDVFKSICQTVTGKAPKDPMCEAEANALLDAVTKEVMGEDVDDDLPE